MAASPRGRDAAGCRPGALALAAVLALAPAPALAGPDASLAGGITRRANGNPGDGGAATELALMWPIDGRFAFGGVVFADDLGTALTDLTDPGTGELLGTVAGEHRWSFGGAWRGEARVASNRRFRMSWGADFGYGRQETDLHGEVQDAVSGVIFATGPTFLWNAAPRHALGLSVAWKHSFASRDADPDRTSEWTTLLFVWRWQGARPQ